MASTDKPVAKAASPSSVSGTVAPQDSARHRYAWWVVVVLTLALLVSFIDRQIVALVVEPLREDLGINDTQVGWLYGGFAIFYALAGLPIAVLADRKSRRLIITIGIVSWSIMTVACGLSRNFAQLLLARIGVGVGEATLGPSTHSLVGDYFPRHLIPRAMSVFQLGAVIGTGVAFLVGGFVVELVKNSPPVDAGIFGTLMPWQLTFIYVGAPGILVALLMLTVREPARKASTAPSGFAWSDLAPLKQFYADNWRTILAHHLGFTSLALVGWAFVFWTPTYFTRIHDVSAGDASQLFGLIYIIAGPAGTLWAPYMAELFHRRGRQDAIILGGMLGGAAVIPFIFLIQLAPSALWAWIFYVPAVFFLNAPFGLANGALPVIAPAHMRAQIAAIYAVVGALFGMGIGPPIAGAINDYLFTGPEGVRYSIMLMSGVFGPLGLVLLWWGRPHYARSLARAEADG